MLESLLILNDKNCAKNGIITFNLFLQFREMLKPEPSYHTQFYDLFAHCHDQWVETIYQTAYDKVSEVVEQERERHKNNTDWVGLIEINSEWLESAGLVRGIFRMCEINWKQMEWPDLETNLIFGLKLTQKLNEVFHYYVTSFYKIIMADDAFDKHELIIVLNSLSQASHYLDSTFDKLAQRLQ
jgi:hypothetical protein